MDLLQAIKDRHSVRSYQEKPIENDVRESLRQIVRECNKESRLNIQLVFDEPLAFDSFMAHYGKFSGVTNYVALIGGKNRDKDIGYYGEKIALQAQTLGLNTCWVAMTYKKVKTAFKVNKGEKLYCVLSIGYGNTQGVSHKVKKKEQVSTVKNPPEWFNNGLIASLLAPTAMNQQKFKFGIENGKVTLKAGVGFYSKIDKGIVKYHFEVGAGKENFEWA